MSTLAELLPISEEVLAFVARHKALHAARTGYGATLGLIPKDDLRRIELTALATREACMFHDLYGSDSAPAPQVQDEC